MVTVHGYGEDPTKIHQSRAYGKLHIEAVLDMLPYLTASGRSLYAKSARIYLQTMLSLEQDYPDVHRNFAQGFHVARRSSRAWAGLSTDLMLEHEEYEDQRRVNKRKRNDRATAVDVAFVHASLFGEEQIDARAHWSEVQHR